MLKLDYNLKKWASWCIQRLQTNDWDHKLLRKMFIEVTDRESQESCHRFLSNQTSLCIVWSFSIWANAGLSHLHTAFTFQTQKLCTSFYRQDVIWSGSHSFSIPPADTSCLIALLSTWPIKGSVLHFIKSYSWILTLLVIHLAELQLLDSYQVFFMFFILFFCWQTELTRKHFHAMQSQWRVMNCFPLWCGQHLYVLFLFREWKTLLRSLL